MTMFGVTTTGGECVRQGLATAGHDVAVFHANGIGGQILEKLAAQGAFSGVLDWTTTELADELVGGIASAGPHRLEAAGAVGVPQLFVPGAMDMVNFGPRDTVPARFADRTFQQHTPVATLMRTTVDENTTLGGLAAKKLNAAVGPVEVVIPARGFSALSAPGGRSMTQPPTGPSSTRCVTGYVRDQRDRGRVGDQRRRIRRVGGRKIRAAAQSVKARGRFTGRPR